MLKLGHWAENNIKVYKYLQGGCRGRSQALLSDAQWQDQKQWAHTETQEVPSERQGTRCHCEGDWALAQVSQGHGAPSILGENSAAIWEWSWATGSTWPCLSRVVGADDLQRSVPTPTIQSFCDLLGERKVQSERSPYSVVQRWPYWERIWALHYSSCSKCCVYIFSHELRNGQAGCGARTNIRGSQQGSFTVSQFSFLCWQFKSNSQADCHWVIVVNSVSHFQHNSVGSCFCCTLSV